MNRPCPLHIMHIVSGDLWAGAESQLFTLTTTLHKHLKATVSVVILNHGKLEEMLRNEGIQVIVLDEQNLNGFHILRQLIAVVRRLKPDVIHTHRIKENIIGSIAARLSGNIPTLRTQHGAPEHHPKWHQLPKQIIHFLDWFCGQFLQQRIIAVSETLAGQLQQQFHAEKIRVVENGIDIDFILQSAGVDNSHTYLSHKSLKIGIAGRLVPVKRIDLFIKTAKFIKESNPNLEIDFLIFGDGPLREELETLNRQLETAGYVSLEGHCNDLARHLSTLDVLVMSSDHEGLPMILLESMVLRTPIVAHRVGGIPKLLDNGKCGVLVDDHTPTGYAQAIDQLVKNPEKRDKIAKNAFNRVHELYSASENANIICKYYLEISAYNS